MESSNIENEKKIPNFIISKAEYQALKKSWLEMVRRERSDIRALFPGSYDPSLNSLMN